MAVMMVMRWDGVSLDQYEQAKKAVDWEENPAEGGILHVTAHDGKGLRITDVWESADAFNTFVGTRLMPGVAELGLPGQPEVEIFELHDLWAPGIAAT